MTLSKGTLFGISFGLIALLALVWFASFPHGIVMGDDLRLIYDIQHGGYGSSIGNDITTAEFGTYRPLLMILFTLLVPLFGTHFSLYSGLNILVELGSAYAITRIAFQLSREQLAVALGVGAAFVFSRLSYYHIGQLFGLMEGLGLLLTLLTVLDIVEAYRTLAPRRLLRATIWYGLSIFVDERFIVAGAFVFGAIALYDATPVSRVRRFELCAVPVIYAALNVALKTFALHTVFLTGSGHPLVLRLDTVVYFLETGLANVLGFNVGPSYLSGADVADVGPLGYIAGLAIALPFLVAVVVIVRRFTQAGEPGGEARRAFLLWFLLFAPLLLSASVNTRQEFRWLYAPYAVALIGFAAVAGNLSDRRRLVGALSICLVAGTVCAAALYRTVIGNIYFYSSEHTAHEIARLASQYPDRALVILTHGDTSIQSWIFMGHEFFDEFKLARGGVSYFNSAADLANAPPVANAPAILDVNAGTVLEIAAPVPAHPAAVSRKPAPLLRPVRSFAADFGSGKINSLTPAATPNGRGAFVISWPSPAGPRLSLTVLATYRYRFDRVPIGPHEKLSFSAASPYAIGHGVHAFIDVSNGPTSVRVYDEDLSPAGAAGPLWQVHEVALDRFAGTSVAVTFGADVRDGDATAAWAAFGEPLLVR